AKRPSHAYLITGPAGAPLADAARALAAALQCPDSGCGHCEACRRVLAGTDPDVTFLERAGVTWRVSEVREAERVGRRRPLGSGRQVVVIEDVDLATTGPSPSAATLLKTIEEPPARTVFILTTEAPGPALATIASRCVAVALDPVSAADLAAGLVAEGVAPQRASEAAAAAHGSLSRARVLARDDSLTARLAAWRAVPDRLSGTPAVASEVAAALSAALDEAIAPLAALQDEELTRRTEEARAVGLRSVGDRRELEAQFTREQRRFRTDDLRFGLSALSDVYRDRLVADLAEERSARVDARLDSTLRALESIAEVHRRLGGNVDESLALADLMLALSGLSAGARRVG
ncbi:MAG TPA: hypothetical protein VGS61_07335, partial [Acidimicrobiales bacterium]|nr:hypothetical protein [Acidimicrobiales bacterium]